LFDNGSIDNYKNIGVGLKYEMDCFGYKFLVKDINVPEQVMGYDEKFISNVLQEMGLQLEHIFYGSWSGRKEALSMQDIIIMKKNLFSSHF